MDTVVIHDDIDAGYPGSWIGMIEECQQVPEERMGLPRAVAMEHLAGGEMQGATRSSFACWPGVMTSSWLPFGHPGRADLGPQVDVERIGKHHHLVRLPRLGEIEYGPSVRPAGAHHPWRPAALVSTPNPSRGASGARSEQILQCRVWS